MVKRERAHRGFDSIAWMDDKTTTTTRRRQPIKHNIMGYYKIQIDPHVSYKSKNADCESNCACRSELGEIIACVCIRWLRVYARVRRVCTHKVTVRFTPRTPTTELSPSSSSRPLCRRNENCASPAGRLECTRSIFSLLPYTHIRRKHDVVYVIFVCAQMTLTRTHCPASI